MEYKIKSLNCNSCGASLIKKINSNLCKCRYCGNSNIILEDGTTKIHFEEITEKEIQPKKEIPIWIVVLVGFISIFLAGYLFQKRHKKKDKKVYEKGGKIQYT